MQFHGGYEETILFDFWQTKSIPSINFKHSNNNLIKRPKISFYFCCIVFLLSCFALFIMAILYEGLKLAREKLIKRELLKRATNRTIPFRLVK